ncbi:ankyrin repeat protein [Trifolium medium]|uniref:Ankyrin repeat protein n=1 Tax=Trifolium medium TaxID=97028 RepID=A0A392QNP8_9FABA|nr:ankyrin repeat protein [Trifolium medium]
MVAATVVATMTCQPVISPPGGVWQEDTTTGGVYCPHYGFCEAGTSVVGYVWSPEYLKFIFMNSASFFASMCGVDSH